MKVLQRLYHKSLFRYCLLSAAGTGHLLNYPPQPGYPARSWAQQKMPDRYVSTEKRSQVVYREKK